MLNLNLGKAQSFREIEASLEGYRPFDDRIQSSKKYYMQLYWSFSKSPPLLMEVSFYTGTENDMGHKSNGPAVFARDHLHQYRFYGYRGPMYDRQ